MRICSTEEGEIKKNKKIHHLTVTFNFYIPVINRQPSTFISNKTEAELSTKQLSHSENSLYSKMPNSVKQEEF